MATQIPMIISEPHDPGVEPGTMQWSAPRSVSRRLSAPLRTRGLSQLIREAHRLDASKATAWTRAERPSRAGRRLTRSANPTASRCDRCDRRDATAGRRQPPARRPRRRAAGHGLPISRVYARYFRDGELEIRSMESFGTDAYVYISRVGGGSDLPS